MAFQGSLAELHLPDIIQLISVSGKTGVFQLTDGELRGQIYLNDGQIVHAQVEGTQGEDAVYALAIWSHGDFKFDPGEATDKHTITKSNTNLLMEAARRLDEWRVLSKKIPSVDMIPEFVVQERRDGQINLNTSEWLILSRIDGQRSIKDIAGENDLSVFDTAKLLYGLIATGLIRLKEAVAGAVQAPEAAPGLARAAPETALARGKPPTRAGRTTAAGRGEVLLKHLDKMRTVCNSVLGSVGESVVNKHYHKAHAEIEKGAGPEAIEEAVQQIARAASILKGPATAKTLLAQLKSSS